MVNSTKKLEKAGISQALFRANFGCEPVVFDSGTLRTFADSEKQTVP